MVHQETLGGTNQQNQRTWSEEYWTYPKHDDKPTGMDKLSDVKKQFVGYN